MPMNLDSVGAVSEPGRTSWTSKDALLYALGVGAGQTDPTGFELEFTTENSPGHRSSACCRRCPSSSSMGGGPGLPSWGEFDFRMLLHGEQGVTVHGPIPPDGEVESVARDRRHLRQGQGRGRAASRTSATYVDTGKPAFDTRFAAFIRGEGGFGESAAATRSPTRRRCPIAHADHEVTYATRADQALLYRLSRRPQPAALRPDAREVRGLRPADPARPLHVRLHRPRAAARAVRLRRRASSRAWTPASRSPSCPATRSPCDVGRRHGHARSSRPSTRTAPS